MTPALCLPPFQLLKKKRHLHYGILHLREGNTFNRLTEPKKKLYMPHLTLKRYQMYKQSLQQAEDP